MSYELLRRFPLGYTSPNCPYSQIVSLFSRHGTHIRHKELRHHAEGYQAAGS